LEGRDGDEGDGIERDTVLRDIYYIFSTVILAAINRD